MELTRDLFMAGCRVLIDNGIETDEAQVVLQALCYVMLSTEAEQFMDDEIRCCQNCANFHAVCGEATYHQCNIHDLSNWESDTESDN